MQMGALEALPSRRKECEPPTLRDYRPCVHCLDYLTSCKLHLLQLLSTHTPHPLQNIDCTTNKMQSRPKRNRSPIAAPTSEDGDRESVEGSSSSDMGVIKRKNIVKGNEGGLKYICDVCSADITSTVSKLEHHAPILRQAGGLVIGQTLTPYRSGYDVPILPVASTTYVCHVSPKGLHPAIMTHGHIPFRS